MNPPMKANEIVSVLARMLCIDIALIASVIGNIPKANLAAWLRGKKDNLRIDSVLRLLQLVGLEVNDRGVGLNENRVHFWRIKDGPFTRNAYDPIRALSKLLASGAITRVELPKRGWISRRRKLMFLVRGIERSNLRLVIEVDKSVFKDAHINPEMIPGTLWRESDDRNRHPHYKYSDHVIPTNAVKWEMLLSHDLAPHEFDQIFEIHEPKLQWNDVALLAREYGVTPDNVHHMILERFHPNRTGHTGAPGGDERPGTMPVDRALQAIAVVPFRRTASG
ncbi:MAG: hypothetical protein WKF61_00405 [Luteimonas sp.]